MQGDEVGTPADADNLTPEQAGNETNSSEVSITIRDIQADQGGTIIIAGRDAQFGYSLEQVESLLEKLSHEFQLKPFSGKCPYPGLEAFQEADATLFFGREVQITLLLERMQTSRFLMITGPSGSGKSSLVRAGLLAKLKSGALEGSQGWLYANLKPGRQPIEGLALAMSRAGRSPQAADYLREHVFQAKALNDVAESLLGDDPNQRMVLFIDQFEEIFTQASGEHQAERQAFLNLLTKAAMLENGRVTILCAMRSDFIPHCAHYGELNELLNQQFFQLGALQPEELVRAVALPAAEVGLRLDPKLVAKVVEDVGSEAGILPLMQFALKDLFEASQSTGGIMELTLEGYLQRGGLHKALQRHAEAEFSHLSETEQKLSEVVFSSLVEIGQGAQDTRRTAHFSELVPAGADPEMVQALIQKLANSRLLTTDEIEGQEQVVFIPHERLLDAWPWLRSLVDENRVSISLQNEISQDAQTWKESNSDSSYLYTGARLSTVQEKLQDKKLHLSTLADQFIATGVKTRDAALQRRRRIIRLTISVLAFAVLIFASLAVWAALAERRATALQLTSRSRELAALAINQMEDAPVRAILIAREALLTEQTSQAQDTLRQALLALPASKIFQPTEGAGDLLATSPDGGLVVTIPETSGSWTTAEIWDTTKLEKRLTLELDSHPAGAVFSADGKWAAVLGMDEIKLWEITTDQMYSITEPDILSEQVVFSPDSATLYVLGYPTIAWETATGNKKFTIDTHSFALSPDGQMIAGWGNDNKLGIWQAEDGAWVRELQQDDTVSTIKIKFSPDSQRILALQGGGGLVRIWDVATGQQVLQHDSLHFLEDVEWVSGGNGQFLTWDSYFNDVRIWEVATDQLLMTLRESQQRGRSECSFRGGFGIYEFTSVPSLSNVVVSPDGKLILTTAAWIARIWDPVTGLELMVNKETCTNIQKASFTLDQRRLIFLDEEGIVYAWDAFHGELPVLMPSQGALKAAAYSRDGEYLATADDLGNVHIWIAETGEEKLRFTTGLLLSLDYSPDGTNLLTTDQSGTASLWKADSGEFIRTLTTNQRTAVYSGDGSRIASAGMDGVVRVWEAVRGDLLHEFRSDDSYSRVSFSQDGQRLLGIGAKLTLWNLASGEVLQTIDAGNFNDASLSSDGKHILTGHGIVLWGDNGFRVWDAETGEQVYEVGGLSRKVDQVQFSPDGQFILTLGDVPRIWDARTGYEIIALRGIDADLVGADFSPDSRRLVVISDDGIAHQYVVQVKDLLTFSLERAGRELSCDEREVYLGEVGACDNVK